MAWWTQRPVTAERLQWTGSNLAAIEAFVLPAYAPLSVDGSGNLLVGSNVIPVGDWLYLNGNHESDASQRSGQQETDGPDDLYALVSQLAALVNPAQQRKTVAVPQLNLLGKTTISVTWDSPMPSSDYYVLITPRKVGTLTTTVGFWVDSQTAAGCVVGAQAPLLGITLGSYVLDVAALAFP